MSLPEYNIINDNLNKSLDEPALNEDNTPYKINDKDKGMTVDRKLNLIYEELIGLRQRIDGLENTVQDLEGIIGDLKSKKA